MTLYKYFISGASTVLELSPQHSKSINTPSSDEGLITDSKSLYEDWSSVGQDIYNSLAKIETESKSDGS